MNDGQDIGALSALYELCNWRRQMNYIGPSVQRDLLSYGRKRERGRILGRNPGKSRKSFPPCYSQSPLQLCLEIYISPATSYSFYSSVTVLYTVKEKGGKPDRKPCPLPYGLRNPYRNLKSENFQDYAQKPQQNCRLMNSASDYLSYGEP